MMCGGRAPFRAPSNRYAGATSCQVYGRLLHARFRVSLPPHTTLRISRDSHSHGNYHDAGRPGTYIFGSNMRCALGVPGSMIQGAPSTGVVERPIDFSVAKGTYITKSDWALGAVPLAGSKLSLGPVNEYSTAAWRGIASLPERTSAKRRLSTLSPLTPL